MPKFKIEVSKNQKKHTLVIGANSPKEARDSAHKEGYSVLNIEEFDTSSLQGKKFYFTVEQNGKKQSGSIYGDDIFKVYLKLRKDLGYTIIHLYLDANESLEKKEDLIKNLNEAYQIYKKNQEKTKSKKSLKNHQEKKEETIDDFYMKKELETTYKLIEFVIAKIEFVLNSKNLGKIDPVRRDKIEQVYHNIIQIKNSTNVSKLKEIGELALIRIGQLELELVEKEKNIYAKQFLKETNKLLKKIGSDKYFIEKDKDIKAQIKLFFLKGHKIIQGLQRERKRIKKKPLDKTSYDYLKTVALLNRYKQRYREEQVKILKHFWYFFVASKKEEFSRLLLIKAVIRQNIIILKAKKSGKIYSYTKIVKGYEKFFSLLAKLIAGLNQYLFIVICSFSLLFLVLISFNYFTADDINHLSFNYYGLYYLILIILFCMISRTVRGFGTLILATISLFGIFVFSSVNF